MKKKIRIYELAKELDLESKVLVEFLNDLGAEVSNHMSSIEQEIADMLRDHFAPEVQAPDLLEEEVIVPKKSGAPFAMMTTAGTCLPRPKARKSVA